MSFHLSSNEILQTIVTSSSCLNVSVNKCYVHICSLSVSFSVEYCAKLLLKINLSSVNSETVLGSRRSIFIVFK
jgi:hypothetical protein